MTKVQIFFIYMIITALSVSCNQQNDFQKIDFEEFSITLPSQWRKIEVKGIDSNVNIVLTSNKDSIYFDLGIYAQKFNETNKVFSPSQIHKYDSLNMDVKWLYSSNTPEIDQAQGTFLKEFYFYDTIGKYIAKVKVPKKYGQGETGIHFNLGNKNALTIIGKNLNSEEQTILLESFKSIKFK